MRDAQLAALGKVDLLIVPVGGGPTIGARQAMEIVEAVEAGIVVPAHYRTERIGFLEPLDEFAAHFAQVQRADTPVVELDASAAAYGPLLVVPAVP